MKTDKVTIRTSYPCTKHQQMANRYQQYKDGGLDEDHLGRFVMSLIYKMKRCSRCVSAYDNETLLDEERQSEHYLDPRFDTDAGFQQICLESDEKQ